MLAISDVAIWEDVVNANGRLASSSQKQQKIGTMRGGLCLGWRGIGRRRREECEFAAAREEFALRFFVAGNGLDDGWKGLV